MKRNILPALLVACTLIVALWLLMARRSSQPFQPFDLTAGDFPGFVATLTNDFVRSLPVSTTDPAEPNILALSVTSIAGLPGYQLVAGGGGDARSQPSTINHQPSTSNDEPSTINHQPSTLLVRLVHGYNMPMCMKIKGYTVEEYGNLKPETRNLSQTRPQSHGINKSGYSSFTSQVSSSTLTQVSGFTSQVSFSLPFQLWRVTSSAGEVSIWVTTMIRAGDFLPTSVDVCSMAFPRVDVPDDPGWVPRGLTWASLRHPVASLKQLGRARWNASRTDLLTFLRLRQPAWASEELLTYITCSVRPEITAANEEDSVKTIIATHTQMLEALQKWRAEQVGAKQE